MGTMMIYSMMIHWVIEKQFWDLCCCFFLGDLDGCGGLMTIFRQNSIISFWCFGIEIGYISKRGYESWCLRDPLPLYSFGCGFVVWWLWQVVVSRLCLNHFPFLCCLRTSRMLVLGSGSKWWPPDIGVPSVHQTWPGNHPMYRWCSLIFPLCTAKPPCQIYGRMFAYQRVFPFLRVNICCGFHIPRM